MPEGAIKDYGEVILTRGNIDIKNVERIKGIYYVECTNLTMEEQEIQFPIINYDNYRIKDVEKGTEFLITRGEECRIKITLPKEYHGRIAVEYCPPWYWRVSEVVSMATLLGMACVICKSRKRMGC